MRLRTALAKSKNLVTVRVLQAIGPPYAQDYITKFGFDPRLHPAYLTMGLGAGAATPVQMAGAYAVFANGGYRISPYLIAKITDAKGNILSQADPPMAGANAERAIDPRNAFVMTTLLRDVVAYGTATRANVLGRKDLAGKTGTTNENVDAWFCGFTPTIVGVAWIGYDQPRTLGSNETGAQAALPIWIAFMQRALKGVPEQRFEVPSGVVQVRINEATGLRDDSSTLSDWFYAESVPRPSEFASVPVPVPGGATQPATVQQPGRSAQEVRNQLF
jgi:penicillin-binding protein 1A